MRWFARKTRRDVWDEVVEGPLGDIEAAARIRDLRCRFRNRDKFRTVSPAL